MHTVDFSPLYAQINEVLVVLGAGLVAYLGSVLNAWLKKHLMFLGEQTDQTLTNSFNRALSNGVQIAMNSLERYEGEHSTVAVKSWIAAEAAQYAINHSPDFMKRFSGLSPDDIAIKALAYLPPVEITTDTTGVTIKAGVVSVSPLPPIPAKAA